MTEHLFLTEKQCVSRLFGDGTERYGRVLWEGWKIGKGFPRPEPRAGNRYYWPAVRAWVDHLYIPAWSGGAVRDGASVAAKGNFDAYTKKRRGVVADRPLSDVQQENQRIRQEQGQPGRRGE